jgi:hypothetical protein
VVEEVFADLNLGVEEGEGQAEEVAKEERWGGEEVEDVHAGEEPRE